ncbi:MAG: hypothetical protein R3A11_07205 [Bdellovibrionota bacterium]
MKTDKQLPKRHMHLMMIMREVQIFSLLRINVLTWLLLIGLTSIPEHSLATEFSLAPRHWKAPGSGPWVITENTHLIERNFIAFQSGMGFMNRPVAIYSDTGQLVDEILGHRVYSELGFAMAIRDELNFGAMLPIILHQNGPDQPIANITSISSGGIGDPLFFVRGKIFDDRIKDVDLGYSVYVSLPLSQVEFAGDNFLTLSPKMIASYRIKDLELASNVGFGLRPKTTFLNFDVGSYLEMNLAASYMFESFHQLGVGTELMMQANRFRVTGSNFLLDFLAGVRWEKIDPWVFSLSYGRNLVEGYIGSNHHVIAQVSYLFERKDRKSFQEEKVDEVSEGRIKISDEEVLLSDQVEFAPESDILIGKSEEILELLFEVLAQNLWIKKIEIAVFTPNDPNVGATELHLAFRRAKKVRDHLEGLGLDPERISSQGYLGYQVQNRSSLDREMVIKILQRGKS